MNFQSLSKKEKIRLLIIFGLILVLPLVLFLVSQIQELRKRAEGTKEVDLQFEPSSGVKSRGEVFRVEIKLYKTAQREIKISGAQAVVLISDKLAINSAECIAPFNALSVARIDDQTMTFMCSIAVGTEPPTLSALGQNFASFEVKVKDDAAFGEALLSFSSTRVTEANVPGQAPDVSTSGQPASYTISEEASPTPSMTVTPTPITTPTPLPTPKLGYVVIHPGRVYGIAQGTPVGLSTLAYDEQWQPIWSGVTYEWGISSANSVGTLSPLIGNISNFTPLNPGTGDIFVVARQENYFVVGGALATVAAIPTIEPTPTITPLPSVTTTPIPSPTQTISTSPSPSPIHPCYEKAQKGDYDCNEKVEETDFTQWLKDFLQGQTSLSFFEYWRRGFYR